MRLVSLVGEAGKSGNVWWKQKRRRGGGGSEIIMLDSYSIFSLLIVFLTFSPAVMVIEANVLTNVMNNAYSLLGYETCEPPNVQDAHNAVKRLKTSMRKELFGQHLVSDITHIAVKAHLDDPSPSKALVLSFHGWAGAGKTFTSEKLMNALYAKGVNSSFIRFFQSSYHFPDPHKVMEYQDLIRRNVQDVIRNCPRGLFIFDEVDKTPAGVLDAVVPFIQSPGTLLDGRDYKKSIFVFLSNVGANDITRISQEAWKDGRRREELTFRDFEEILSNEAFNSKSGLYKSQMIDKVLVDYFVPFLPLERQHIISCIKVAAKLHKMDPSIIEEEAEKIADLLTYWPADLKLYSTTGCKKVDTFVKYRMSELSVNRADSDGDDSSYDLVDPKTEL